MTALEAEVDGGLGAAATRLARLLSVGGGGLADPTGSAIEFEPTVAPALLRRGAAPAECWACDGGQALVADARTLQVVATRASTVRFRDGRCDDEVEGELLVHIVGCGEERLSLARMGSPVAPSSPVDVGLLREWGEWRSVAAAVDAAEAGALVLVDGDLQPDWRIPSWWLADLVARATERGVVLAGVTKHSSLARGAAPLVGLLEQEAAEALGPRAMWWCQVGHVRPDVGAGLQVLVARLDPDARFAFRVDLPDGVDPEATLGALSALSTDAAFPGYPYPLTVADRLAACAGWVRADLWTRLDELVGREGVAAEVRERAFADRHRLMERA